MTALELTIYPKAKPIPRFTYSADPYPAQARERLRTRKLIESKRLTDAELAAEFWAASMDALHLMGNARRGGKSHAANVAMTLNRFATLPHYDEDQP